MIATSLKNIKTTILDIFSGGGYSRMVARSLNHLFGRRRVYAAPISVSKEIFELVKNDEAFRHRLHTVLRCKRDVAVYGAIVDDEVRLSVYAVSYEEYLTRVVGGDNPITSGITTILFSRDLEDDKATKVEATIVNFPIREKRINPYEPEFSWTIDIEKLGPCLIQQGQFNILTC